MFESTCVNCSLKEDCEILKTFPDIVDWSIFKGFCYKHSDMIELEDYEEQTYELIEKIEELEEKLEKVESKLFKAINKIEELEKEK